MQSFVIVLCGVVEGSVHTRLSLLFSRVLNFAFPILPSCVCVCASVVCCVFDEHYLKFGCISGKRAL